MPVGEIGLARGTIPPEERSEHWTPERERGGHNIQRSQPDIILAAIREVVELARQRTAPPALL